MIINLSQGTKTSRDRLKIIYDWAQECMDFYDLGDSVKNNMRSYFMTEEGAKFFIDWLQEHKKIKVSFWKLNDPGGMSQIGFHIEDNPNLTLALLK